MVRRVGEGGREGGRAGGMTNWDAIHKFYNHKPAMILSTLCKGKAVSSFCILLMFSYTVLTLDTLLDSRTVDSYN